MGRGDKVVEPEPNSAPDALSVDGVSFSFPGRLALDNVSISVPSARFCVLLGVNGAGKTTFFSLATRLYNCRSGAIRIFDDDIRKQPSHALSRIGVVFQQPTLDLDLSINQNLYYFAALQGLGPQDARRRVADELDRNGLAGRAKDKVRHLSGGQRRRVELARALLHRPSFLLLDEPTVGLDVHSRQSILEHVRDLCLKEGVSVLWSTHLIDEVDESDLLFVLHAGRVLFSGSVPDVLEKTGATTVQEAFVALTGGERKQ